MHWSLAQDSASRHIFRLLVIFTAATVSLASAQENWALLIGAVAVPLVLLWPVQMSLGIFAFLVPFDSVAVLGDKATGMTLNLVVGAVSAAILLGMGVVNRRFERPPRAAIWWILFIAWSTATALWAVEPDKAWQRLPTAFALLFLYVVAVSFRMSRKELGGVVLLTILGALAAAALPLLQFLHGGGTIRASLAMSGKETDPNQWAASLLLPLSLAIGAFFSSSGWFKRLAAMAAVALISFCILLSMSRGSLVAVAVMIGVYLYRGSVNWRTILPVSVLALLLFAVPGLFFVRIQEGLQDKGAGRFDIWQVGLVAVEHNGVFGGGLDSFPALYQEYAANAPIFRGYRRGPHNIYLGITAEMGIIGLLLFLGAVGSQLRVVRHFKTAADRQIFPLVVACEAACWGMLAAAFFLDVLWRKAFWFSWILLAIASRQPRADYEAATK